MNRAFYVVAACLWTFAAMPLPAMANNNATLPEMAMIGCIPLMMLLFTTTSGGESILKAKKRITALVVATRVAFGILFLFGMVIAGFMVFAGFIAWAVACARGLELMMWGSRARTGDPALAGKNWKNLVGSGICLVLLSSLSYGAFWAFVGYFPESNESDEWAIEIARYEMAYAKVQQQLTGERRFQEVPDHNSAWMPMIGDWDRRPSVSLEVTPDKKDFVALVRSSGLPFFPYGFITAQPSFRITGSGKVQMIMSHFNGEECPANAPVVYTVSDDEIDAEILSVRDYHKGNPDTPDLLAWADQGKVPPGTDADGSRALPDSEGRRRAWAWRATDTFEVPEFFSDRPKSGDSH